MKLLTLLEPAALVLWPTLLEVLVLVALEGLAGLEVELGLPAGAVEPDDEAVPGVAELAPALPPAEAGAVDGLESEEEGVAPAVDVPAALGEPVPLPEAAAGAVGAVVPPVVVGVLAADGAGGAVRFCGAMSGSSSMVMGVARAACRGPVAPTGLAPDRAAEEPAWPDCPAPEAPAAAGAIGPVAAALVAIAGLGAEPRAALATRA